MDRSTGPDRDEDRERFGCRLIATKRIPRPHDPIALAKLIGDLATGEVVDAVEDGKHAAAVKRGRAGGSYIEVRSRFSSRREAVADFAP